MFQDSADVVDERNPLSLPDLIRVITDYPLTFQQQLLVLKYFQLFYLSDCGKPSRVARWCKCSGSWSSNKQRMNMNIMNMNMITTLSMFIQQVTYMYVPVHSWKKKPFFDKLLAEHSMRPIQNENKGIF